MKRGTYTQCCTWVLTTPSKPLSSSEISENEWKPFHIPWMGNEKLLTSLKTDYLVIVTQSFMGIHCLQIGYYVSYIMTVSTLQKCFIDCKALWDKLRSRKVKYKWKSFHFYLRRAMMGFHFSIQSDFLPQRGTPCHYEIYASFWHRKTLGWSIFKSICVL